MLLPHVKQIDFSKTLTEIVYKLLFADVERQLRIDPIIKLTISGNNTLKVALSNRITASTTQGSNKPIERPVC